MNIHSNEFAQRLHEFLLERTTEDELRDVCLYLNIEYADLGSGGRRARLRELIHTMERQHALNLLCHNFIQVRKDLETEIEVLARGLNGAQTYLDIAVNKMLPPRGMDHVLQNPDKMYIPLNCSEVSGSHEGEDALLYIDSSLKNKQTLLIVGDYGTGKSFLVQRLFLAIAQDYRTENTLSSRRIPIFLPLKQLVGRGEDIVLTKMVEHLHSLRFFSDSDISEHDERIEFERRLHAGEFLCILDGFDEIPLIAIRLTPLDELVNILKSLAVGNNRVVITSRPAILSGLMLPSFAEGSALAIGYLQPWQPDQHWYQYLAMCARCGVDFGNGYTQFQEWVLSRPELRALTITPLYCRMLVETREVIRNRTDLNVAKLYDIYTERYFFNVSERGLLRHRLPDLEKEISYKRDCLAATAIGMLEKGSIRLTGEEIDQSLQRHAQNYDDDLLEAFTKLDTLIYSLLIPDSHNTFTFSHKSFFEYYVAHKARQELENPNETTFILGQVLLSNEIIDFLAGVLTSSHPFAEKLDAAFQHSKPLTVLGMHTKNRILLRNLAVVQLALKRQIKGVVLEGLDFSRYRFLSNGYPIELVNVDLNRCEMENATLIGAVLRDCKLRAAKLNRCIFDGADLRDADLTGAYLHDISCDGTRFSGAIFHGASLKCNDADRIRSAFYAEKAKYPKTVNKDWLIDTMRILDNNAV